MATRSSLMDFQTPRISSEDADERAGRFTIEPLDRGFGYTFGNSLRPNSPAEAIVRDATDLTAAVTPWLQADHDGLTGKMLKWPERAEIDTPVQESLIVELYSK